MSSDTRIEAFAFVVRRRGRPRIEAREVLEIGGTYNRPHLRGTGFKPRVKDMMLARASASGIRRAEFRVDIRNQRSQAAMKKLGAVREGVLRADRITWTGHVRDTVLIRDPEG